LRFDTASASLRHSHTLRERPPMYRQQLSR
jgi:hypothetical protein